MSTLSRTLITFTAFIINYALVVKVHPEGINQIQHVIVWLVFLTMTVVAVHQWDASYLFGSFVLVYIAMIANKTGLSLESLAAAITGLTMGMTISGYRISQLMGLELAGSALKWITGKINGYLAKLQVERTLKRLRKLAGARTGGEKLGHEELAEFMKMEADADKVYRFFDGSDLPLEKVLKGTIGQIMELQRNHARLLLRSEHLQGLILSEPRESLENEISELSRQAANEKDPVVQAQLKATVEMKNRRINELDKLVTCLARVKAQRLQIIDTVQSTFGRLNGLKYCDIQTLEASRDSIFGLIKVVQGDLDSMESGLKMVEMNYHKE